jgi:hypothetical protein
MPYDHIKEELTSNKSATTFQGINLIQTKNAPYYLHCIKLVFSFLKLCCKKKKHSRFKWVVGFVMIPTFELKNISRSSFQGLKALLLL